MTNQSSTNSLIKRAFDNLTSNLLSVGLISQSDQNNSQDQMLTCQMVPDQPAFGLDFRTVGPNKEEYLLRLEVVEKPLSLLFTWSGNIYQPGHFADGPYQRFQRAIIITPELGLACIARLVAFYESQASALPGWKLLGQPNLPDTVLAD